MKHKYLYLSLVTIAIISIFAITIFAVHTPFETPSTTNIEYTATVCTYKTPWLGDHYGEQELVGCSHNLLYNLGRNMTRNALSYGGTGVVTNISLCNATAGCASPLAGANEGFTVYDACGLTSSAGTVAPLTIGNWSVYKTFISTCDNIEVNATRLSNATGSLFAGNTFTIVTLQTNDQLTINWTLGVA